MKNIKNFSLVATLVLCVVIFFSGNLNTLFVLTPIAFIGLFIYKLSSKFMDEEIKDKIYDEIRKEQDKKE